MGLVKVVVQLKNDIPDLKPEQYITIVQVRPEGDCRLGTRQEQTYGVTMVVVCPQSVGMALRDLIRSVDDILPTLHESIRTEVGPSGPDMSSSLHFAGGENDFPLREDFPPRQQL